MYNFDWLNLHSCDVTHQINAYSRGRLNGDVNMNNHIIIIQGVTDHICCNEADFINTKGKWGEASFQANSYEQLNGSAAGVNISPWDQ